MPYAGNDTQTQDRSPFVWSVLVLVVGSSLLMGEAYGFHSQLVG